MSTKINDDTMSLEIDDRGGWHWSGAGTPPRSPSS